MILTLTRYAYCETHTAGRVAFDNFRIHTIERPWLGNKPFKSCIPAGSYRVERRESVKFGSHWHVQDVPERSLILIHAANYASELSGCIAPGMRSTFDCKRMVPMVADSRKAMQALNEELNGLDFWQLNIVNFFPEYP